MKKSLENNVTTVRLPRLAEALLLAEVEARQAGDANITKTDVLVECIMEHLKQRSPDRALQALIAAAGDDPQLRYALEIANSSGDNSGTKADLLTRIIAEAVAGRQRGRAPKRSGAAHELSESVRPMSKRKSRP